MLFVFIYPWNDLSTIIHKQKDETNIDVLREYPLTTIVTKI